MLPGLDLSRNEDGVYTGETAHRDSLNCLLMRIEGIGRGVPARGGVFGAWPAGWLWRSGMEGWTLVEAARSLVGERMVYCRRNRFPAGTMNGHAWVRVTYQGESREVDPGRQNPEDGSLLFESLSRVTHMSFAFLLLSGWGCTAANAYRYYRTGSDTAGGY